MVVLVAFSGLREGGSREKLREQSFERNQAERVLQKTSESAVCSIWRLKEGQGLVFKDGSIINQAVKAPAKKDK